MTLIEGFATFFGLLCVWATIKQNIWCWPTGIIQVVLYIFVFYEAKLYSDVLLHIIYVFLNIYGWYHWVYGDRTRKQIAISHVGKKLPVWLILCVVGAFVSGFIMSRYTKASMPYPDSFIMIVSLAAQWLMARKKLESWLFWIVVDVIAIWVYWKKELYLTTGLYSVFLLLAIIGYIEWRKSLVNSNIFN